MYPKCSYRYTSQIGYTLCDYGNDNLEAHKKKKYVLAVLMHALWVYIQKARR